MKKEFDPSKWRSEKYSDKTLVFLDSNEAKSQLKNIQKFALQIIRDKQTEFREDLGADYDIVGIIIFGSWARGDVHLESDIDIFTIATDDPASLDQGFADVLGRKTKRQVESQGHVLVSDESQIQEIRSGKHKLIGNDYIVVTANKKVKSVFAK